MYFKIQFGTWIAGVMLKQLHLVILSSCYSTCKAYLLCPGRILFYSTWQSTDHSFFMASLPTNVFMSTHIWQALPQGLFSLYSHKDFYNFSFFHLSLPFFHCVQPSASSYFIICNQRTFSGMLVKVQFFKNLPLMWANSYPLEIYCAAHLLTLIEFSNLM